MKKIFVIVAMAVGMLAAPQVASAAILGIGNPAACSAGYINISYDDSPTQSTTGLLTTLKNNGLKATFFIVGDRAIQYPTAVGKIAADGHQIENHSWIHQDMSQPTDIQVAIDLAKDQGMIAGMNKGVEPTFFRPPYGIQANPDVLQEVGLTEVVWTIDTNDWQNPPVQTIVDTVLTAKAGDFVLMHDGYPNTLNAIPKIAAGLKAKGLCTGKIVYSSTPTKAWEGRYFNATVAKF